MASSVSPACEADSASWMRATTRSGASATMRRSAGSASAPRPAFWKAAAASPNCCSASAELPELLEDRAEPRVALARGPATSLSAFL